MTLAPVLEVQPQAAGEGTRLSVRQAGSDNARHMRAVPVLIETLASVFSAGEIDALQAVS